MTLREWRGAVLALSASIALSAGAAADKAERSTSNRKPVDGRSEHHPLDKWKVAVVKGTDVFFVKFASLRPPIRRSIAAAFAGSPAAASTCDTTVAKGFVVSACGDGAWVCSAVILSDGTISAYCKNGTTGQTWSFP